MIPLGEQQIVFLKAGEVYLGIVLVRRRSAGRGASGDGPHYPGWRHIAFQVDDVEATIAAMGDDAKITLGPLDFSDFIPGWKTVWLADPDGNIVEVSQGYTDEDSPPPLETT